MAGRLGIQVAVATEASSGIGEVTVPALAAGGEAAVESSLARLACDPGRLRS